MRGKFFFLRAYNLLRRRPFLSRLNFLRLSFDVAQRSAKPLAFLAAFLLPKISAETALHRRFRGVFCLLRPVPQVHESLRTDNYGEPWGEGDVIGFLIKLKSPSEEEMM